MKFLHYIAAICALSVLPAKAQETNLRQLLSPNDARAWQAVGLLQLGGRATCTGTLIAANQVLTAAHCLFDKDTKKQYSPDQIQFLTGWRLGRAASYRTARRVVIHRDYRDIGYDGRSRRDLVASDLAIVELDRPVDANIAKPFQVHSQPRTGDSLTVVSYAKGRNEAPSLEEGCKVLGRDTRVLMATCSVDFGSSGAPIFSIIDGTPKISSVISAKGESKGVSVAFGVALGEPLQDLHDQLEFDKSVFQGKRIGGSIAEQLGRKKN